MALYHNAKGIGAGGTSNTIELLRPKDGVSLTSINIANVHASAAASVTLFIQNDPESGTTNTYKIIENIKIPAKSSLLLDNPAMINYAFEYGLYIEIGNTDTLDVVMSKR